MRTVAIIPARYQSSRFPGKPLAKINGTPMILHVAELTAHAVGAKNTYVATDNEEIATTVETGGYSAIMTSPGAMTGTDRIAEAAKKVVADRYINVQGDEPMLDPLSIIKLIKLAEAFPQAVMNAYAALAPDEDPHDPNLPKCVISRDNRLLYMSRAAIPGSKTALSSGHRFYKQVCIYAFNSEQLEAFSACSGKAPCESVEDIEILRFLDLGFEVRMLQLPGNTLAVDIPADIAKVEAAMSKVSSGSGHAS